LFSPNIALNVEAIKKGACANPDGHGWAVASAEYGLVIGKSMDPEVALAEVVVERERQGLNSFAMVHSRIGTHGTKDITNVHPFYVPDPRGDDDDKTIMAHNGIMPSLWYPSKGDPRSDTRVFADRTAAWYLTERGIPSRRGGRMLGEMIGRGNKLVFISVRQPGRPQVRIVNASSGVWDDGVWYSNESYKRARTWSRSTPSGGKICAETGCNVTFYNSASETKCFKHREKAAEPVTSRAGYVSPYANSDQEYDSYSPGGETAETVDTETADLLKDIDDAMKDYMGGVVSKDDIDTDHVCEVCRTRGVVHIPTNICLNCRWCLDCYVVIDECTCFPYASWMREREEEAAELKAALADDEAEQERIRAEQNEERWLALSEAEKIQALRFDMGMTTEQAKEAIQSLDAAIKSAREAKEEAEKAEPVTAKKSGPKKSGPKSTKPTVTSGR
jgi:glutamine amidotransferase